MSAFLVACSCNLEYFPADVLEKVFITTNVRQDEQRRIFFNFRNGSKKKLHD